MVAASIAIAPRLIGSAHVQPAADTAVSQAQQVGYGYHTAVDTDPNASTPPGVRGFDIDYYHPVTDWNAVHHDGYQFAYVEAADGDVRNTNFDTEYGSIAQNGLLRGAYFFARPSEDPAGVRQADAFLSEINYQKDGRTLPPVLDVEEASCDPANPQDPINQQLVGYVRGFLNEVKAKTGVNPMIYTNRTPGARA